MARARLESEHDRTAMLMATVVNMLRDPRKGKPVRWETLNPYREQPTAPRLEVGIEALRVFLPREERS